MSPAPTSTGSVDGSAEAGARLPPPEGTDPDEGAVATGVGSATERRVDIGEALVAPRSPDGTASHRRPPSRMKTATNTTATSATSLAIERGGGALAGAVTGSRVAGSSVAGSSVVVGSIGAGSSVVGIVGRRRRRRSLPVGRRFVAHPGRA